MGKPSKVKKHMNPMEQYLNGSMSGGSPENKDVSGPLVEDEMTGKKTGKITLNKPSGFKMPDGVKDGEPFDAMATLKMENGKLVLHELDGAPVEDEHEGAEGEEEETPEEEASETPEEESSEDESSEDHSDEEDMSDEDKSEPSTEEPEANDSGESEDFLSAVEKKAKKFKK